jgi:hypothetical protein
VNIFRRSTAFFWSACGWKAQIFTSRDHPAIRNMTSFFPLKHSLNTHRDAQNLQTLYGSCRISLLFFAFNREETKHSGSNVQIGMDSLMYDLKVGGGSRWLGSPKPSREPISRTPQNCLFYPKSCL